MIWTKEFTIEDLNKENGPTNPFGLYTNPFEIEFIEKGVDYLVCKMPITPNTKQPMGLLHGGVSVYLAETIGSYAANLAIKKKNKAAVGLDINANHLRGVKSGFVYAKAKAIHIGGKTQVWSIEITNEAKQLTCISRLTMAVISV
ncbi:MAG: hotdog fold thioesterase [Flavobacteriaceae bacterium]